MVDQLLKLYDFGVNLELLPEDEELSDRLGIVRDRFRALARGNTAVLRDSVQAPISDH